MTGRKLAGRLVLGGWVVAALGCRATVGARGTLHAGSDAKVEAAPSGSASGTVVPATPRIRYVGGKLFVPGKIEFARDRAELEGEETFNTLGAVRDYLAAHPDMKVKIEGHTDATATDEYNLSLSRQRAGAVRKWLSENGIAAARLSHLGYGESRPIADNDTDEGRARNRRVEFVIVAGQPAADDPEDAPPAAAPSPPSPPPARPELPPPPVAAPGRACPSPDTGFHLNLGGPRTALGAAFAHQPTCWLELALGLGANRLTGTATSASTRADAEIDAAVVPARARFWLGRRHAFLIDAGVGVIAYDARAEVSDAVGGMEYRRTGTPLLGFAGAGYGYRSSGSFRFALLLGGAVQQRALDASEISASGGYSLADALELRAALDDLTDDLVTPTAYLEASFGFLF